MKKHDSHCIYIPTLRNSAATRSTQQPIRHTAQINFRQCFSIMPLGINNIISENRFQHADYHHYMCVTLASLYHMTGRALYASCAICHRYHQLRNEHGRTP